MLKVHQKQHIRCATVETPTAWLVVAVLLETTGTETVAVSEPRVIKVIPKPAAKTLKGTHAYNNSKFYLSSLSSSLQKSNLITQQKILSPYVPNFGYAQSNIITWLAARPPTF